MSQWREGPGLPEPSSNYMYGDVGRILLIVAGMADLIPAGRMRDVLSGVVGVRLLAGASR